MSTRDGIHTGGGKMGLHNNTKTTEIAVETGVMIVAECKSHSYHVGYIDIHQERGGAK